MWVHIKVSQMQSIVWCKALFQKWRHRVSHSIFVQHCSDPMRSHSCVFRNFSCLCRFWHLRHVIQVAFSVFKPPLLSFFFGISKEHSSVNVAPFLPAVPTSVKVGHHPLHRAPPSIWVQPSSSTACKHSSILLLLRSISDVLSHNAVAFSLAVVLCVCSTSLFSVFELVLCPSGLQALPLVFL